LGVIHFKKCRKLRELFLCTRGPGIVNLWCSSCRASGSAG